MKIITTFTILINLSFATNILTQSQYPNLAWAKRTGGTNADTGNSIDLDIDGNVYVTGAFRDTVDFDPGMDTFDMIAKGESDIFISKLDAQGSLMWARQSGGVKLDEGKAICTDVNGYVYITGIFTGTASFDTINLTSNGSTDIFVSKYDTDGNFIWVKQIGGSGEDISASIDSDVNGNVFITGHFKNIVDFDPDPSKVFNLISAGQEDAFILKLDSSGQFCWATQIGGTSFDRGRSIKVHDNGNVYTTGSFLYTINVYPGLCSLTSIASYDSYILQLDNNSGNCIWAKQIGGTGNQISRSIAVDSIGNVYTIGEFQYSTDFGGCNENTGGNFYIFILKHDVYGNCEWLNVAGTPTLIDFGKSIVVDLKGNVYIFGDFRSTAYFGSFTLTSNGDSDVFLSKLDSDGNFLWAMQMGGSNIDSGSEIKVDANGSIYATGFFRDTADFDPNGIYNMTSAGEQDMFVTKICQIENPMIMIGGSTTICEGETVTLKTNVDSTYHTYQWSTGETTEEIVVSSTGNYSVTVTFPNGCSAYSSIVSVDVNPLPLQPIINPSDITICEGSSVILEASDANSYEWNTGETTQKITITEAGNYLVTITDSLGCTASSDTALVAISLLPTVDLGDNIVLQQGQQTTLEPIITGNELTYEWSTGDTSSIITVDSMGTYSVTVTDNFGCTATDDIFVEIISSTIDQHDNVEILINPNPTKNKIYFKSYGITTTSIQVFNNIGEVVIEENVLAASGIEQSLDLEFLPSGIYFLRLIGEEFSKTVSIVKH